MRILPALLSLPLFLWTACSSGSGSAAATPTGSVPGSLQVVIDTTAGRETIVQAQLAAVALKSVDGSLTGDLLHGPRLCTL